MSNPGARWFSADPGKAWAEKFFLFYSPAWMAVMALSMVLGLPRKLGDAGLLALSLLVALPLFVFPLLLRRGKDSVPWLRSYWFKANLYIALFSFVGNYFGSEYFFDVLGMTYRFPRIRLNLDSTLLGSGRQEVPLAMYFFTHAYFMTYHTSAAVVLRRIRTSRIPAKALLFPCAVAAVAYFWAWAETFAMANPLMEGIFGYADRGRMLVFGSLFYALYFLVSFPLFLSIDEREDRPWNPSRVALGGLAAGMLTLLLLDLATRFVGAIT